MKEGNNGIYSKIEIDCYYKFTNAYFGLLMEIHKLILNSYYALGLKYGVTRVL